MFESNFIYRGYLSDKYFFFCLFGYLIRNNIKVRKFYNLLLSFIIESSV